MVRENLNDLVAFAAVAQARSFTKAAAQLGVTPSRLSHAMKGLEERLGLRLLARTTRSVAPTEAGERLLQVVRRRFDEIDTEIAALSALREKPAGTVRLTANEHAATCLLYPVIARLLREYPDIEVDVSVDNAFADIVANRFDAGVRFGERVERDMVAVRIAPDMRMAVVGAPSYFAHLPKPQTPRELVDHRGVNMRLPTYGNILPWEFEKDGREITVQVQGQLTINNLHMGMNAVLDGLGLGYSPEDLVLPYVAEGRLIRVLEDWCPPFAGYHLYFPSRRQLSPAFAVLVEALRYRPNQAS